MTGSYPLIFAIETVGRRLYACCDVLHWHSPFGEPASHP
jgi:hypothetical protein